MRWLSQHVVPVVLVCLVSSAGPVFGEESATTFSFQYSGIRYVSSSVSSKPKGSASTSNDTTDLSTSGADSYAWVTHGNWNFYLYPFTGGTPVGLSYMLNSSVELGGFLGLQQWKTDENKAAKDTLSLSPFVTYYHTVGAVTLENYLSLDILQSSTESTDSTSGVKTETESNGTGLTLQVVAAYPLSKTFFFVPSIKYSTFMAEDKAKTETTSNVLTITPFALRTTFN